MAGEAYKRKQGAALREAMGGKGSLVAKTIRNPKLKQRYREWESEWREDLRVKGQQLYRMTRER